MLCDFRLLIQNQLPEVFEEMGFLFRNTLGRMSAHNVSVFSPQLSSFLSNGRLVVCDFLDRGSREESFISLEGMVDLSFNLSCRPRGDVLSH